MESTVAKTQDPLGPRAVMPAPGSARPTPEALRALRRFHLGLAEEESPAPGVFRPLLAPEPNPSSVTGDLDTVLRMTDTAARTRFLPAWEAFTDERRELAELLRGSLAANDAKDGGGTEQALRGEVGVVGARFLDPGALSRMLGTGRSSPGQTPERAAALRAALVELDASLGPEAMPSMHLVLLDELAPLQAASLKGWTVVTSTEPCDTAAARFDESADLVAALLRDLRLAKLETQGAYDPARHDPWLAALRWDVFEREELMLVPPVVAVVTADHVSGPGMVALSQLLRSRRPVQVVVLVDPGRDAEDDVDGAVRFEPGYLGMSHREALVLQTSLARPDHARQGLELGLTAAHAALHVVATGGDPAAAEAAIVSRALPLFHYDPELGRSWAKRLDFSDNPSPNHDWVPVEVLVRGERGGDEKLTGAFTFADFALGDPHRALEFRPIPNAWSNDHVVPLAEYLDLEDEDALRRIPFVWGVGDDGRGVRLAVTRRLAQACADRLGYWRTLQELAGVRNEYVEAAETRARNDSRAAAETELARIRSEHAAEVNGIRENAADDIVRRLVAVLLDVDLGPAAPARGGLPLAGNAEEMAAALLSLIDAESLDGTGVQS